MKQSFYTTGMKQHIRGACVLLFLLAFFSARVSAQQLVTIAEVNQDDLPDYTATLFGELVEIRGIATVASGMLGNNERYIYVQDETGGVNIQRALSGSVPVALGDSVRVVGWVWQDAGQTYVLISSGHVLEVMSQAHPVPEPVEVTAQEIDQNGEEYEGLLVKLSSVTLVDPENWPTEPIGADRTLTLSDATGTCNLVIDKDSNIPGTEAPEGAFAIIGLIGQRDTSIPYDENYRLIPRRAADIIGSPCGSGEVSIQPRVVEASSDNVTVSVSVTAVENALNSVAVVVAPDWEWSGQAADAELSGGFSGGTITAQGDSLYAEGFALEPDSTGLLSIMGMTATPSIGSSMFKVYTGAEGCEIDQVAVQPTIVISSSADPGDVVINEFYADVAGQIDDGAEFIELYNTTDHEIELTGWILTDIGEGGRCGGKNYWQFPEGAVIRADSHLVIAKDASPDDQDSFFNVFGFSPDYELHDWNYFVDKDDPAVPNLVLVSEDGTSSTVSSEIRLLGGEGNGKEKYGVDSYEAVYLYTDVSLANLIDVVEYRDIVFWDADGCEGYGSSDDDAFTPGAPPAGYSLSRDAESTDTDNSGHDFHLSSHLTPGEVNQPSDDRVPNLVSINSYSSYFVELVFDEWLSEESVDNADFYVGCCTQLLQSYQLSKAGNRILLVTGRQDPGVEHILTATGLADLAGNSIDIDRRFFGYEGRHITPLCEVQDFDENGYSPYDGETVTVQGFVTVPPGAFQPEYTSIYVQDPVRCPTGNTPGPSGITAFAYDQMAEPALLGDLVEVTGQILEYQSSSGPGLTTEISLSSPSQISILSRGYNEPEPIELKTGEVSNEAYEGVLIVTSGVVVQRLDYALYIDDGSGAIQIYQNYTTIDFSQYDIGDSLRATGVVLQYDRTIPFLSGYEVAPRYESDLELMVQVKTDEARVKIAAGVLVPELEETVTIKYNAPPASMITVRVFDLVGREVRTLYHGLSLGGQEIEWDGTDSKGKALPIGTYICHIQAEDATGTDSSTAAAPIVIGTRLE
jgi:hypothetical protein